MRFFKSGRCYALIGLGYSCVVSFALAYPETYYNGAVGLRGEALRSALETKISGHRALSYTPGLWEALPVLYADPQRSGHLILFYSQASWDVKMRDQGSGSEQFWNREHLWPTSYGVGTSGPDYTDLFHVVPANKRVNNVRGNKYFAESLPTASGYNPQPDPLAPECTSTSASWEPGDGQKGWVARSMFYMVTRYDYLQLVDTPPSPAPSSSANRMAQLSTLLKWNRRHLPDTVEETVNERIFTDFQYNRNPYIDIPELADAVFVAGPSWGGWRLEHFSFAELADDLISGPTADPDRDGVPNLIELAQYADPRVAGPQALRIQLLPGGAIELRFTRASQRDHLGIELQLQESDDMEDWDIVPLGSASLSTLNTTQQEVRVQRTAPASGARFYRLVALPES